MDKFKSRVFYVTLRKGKISFQRDFFKSYPEELLMEQRIGTITILITGKDSVKTINDLLSEYSEIILARQGLPLASRKISVISLIIEGSTEKISALTGKIGRLKDVEVKSVLTKYREEKSDEHK